MVESRIDTIKSDRHLIMQIVGTCIGTIEASRHLFVQLIEARIHALKPFIHTVKSITNFDDYIFKSLYSGV